MFLSSVCRVLAAVKNPLPGLFQKWVSLENVQDVLCVVVVAKDDSILPRCVLCEKTSDQIY